MGKLFYVGNSSLSSKSMNIALVKRTMAGAKIYVDNRWGGSITSFFDVDSRNPNFYDYVLMSISGEIWLEENYSNITDAQESCEFWNRRIQSRI